MHRCLFIYVNLCTHTDQLSLILEGVLQRKIIYNFFKLWGREQCISCELLTENKTLRWSFHIASGIKKLCKGISKRVNLG